MPDRRIDRERTEWTFHPLADIFPMMDETALAELAADIKAESQREPIYLWQDQIIDGRNRYRACKIAGVEPVFKRIDFPGGESEALAYVVSRNLKRRHLTTPQRAVIAAKVATLKGGGDQSSKKSNGVSQEKAAEMLNVSRTSVQAAKAVLKTGDAE
jgi:ParB-like chromosome segregation protein Spo0J